MENKEVFLDPCELERLNTQIKLFSDCETPVCQSILTGENLCVLDIGSSNGAKTSEKFDRPNVRAVVGFEYHESLAKYAEEYYGSEKFSFYPSNVEDDSFDQQLKTVMEEKGIEGFDVINMSLVLSHLKAPHKLLGKLKGFLNPGGRLFIMEVDDSSARLEYDEKGLFREFLDMLRIDVFAGDRTISHRIETMLKSEGYQNIAVTTAYISAEEKDVQKKEDIYKVFFSYLEPDLKVLIKDEPSNPDYIRCKQWLHANADELQGLICGDESKVYMSIKMFSCYIG